MAAANKTSARSERTSGVGPLTIEGDWAPLIYLRAKGAREGRWWRSSDCSFPPNALVGVFRELQAGLHRAQTGRGRGIEVREEA